MPSPSFAQRFGQLIRLATAAVVGLGLISASLPEAFAQDRERSNRFHEDAKRALQRGDLRTAIIQLKNAVRADVNNLEARFDLGLGQLRAGDAPSAEKDLLVARERGFDERRLAVPYGDSLLAQNKYEEVLAQLQPGDRGRDIEARVLAQRGFALMALGRLPEAERTLTQSIESEPFALAHLALARVFIARGNQARAEEEIDSSIALQPLPDALVAKGELSLIKGDQAKAREVYDRAVQIEPANWRARLARAALLINQANDAAAAQDVQAVMTANARHPLGLYYRGLLEARRNDLSAAASTLQQIDPDFVNSFPTAQYLVGAVAYARNQLELAEDNLRRYLASVPNHLQARKILAATQIRLNRPGNALTTL
jgi:tetratricopeptide (TPR) repeat protein